MRDFPVFTTENGVGSLVLKEIPYSGAAYITIHDSSFPTKFLDECVSFCRAVGAEKVYAAGDEVLEKYPLYTAVIKMTAIADQIPQTDAYLFPVTEKTISQWCRIYNDRMMNVDNAAYMSDIAAKELLKRGDGYFVHKDGSLLGIGIATVDSISCVASVERGKGRDIVSALVHGLCGDTIQLEVASTNHRAIRLYESLGFTPIAEVSRWYKIF